MTDDQTGMGLSAALDEPAREIVRALRALWQIAYRHLPTDRDLLDAMEEHLDALLERHDVP